MALATYEACRYIVHVAHQHPFNVRDRVAQTLGVPKSAVRVIGHHIGGGFGAKLDIGLEAYAALLARRTRRPVNMVNTRQEDLLTAPCRENAVVKIRSALRKDGTILAQDVDVVFDSGAYAIDAPYLTSIPMFIFGSVYRVGTARVVTRSVYTNTAPTGAFRGVSGTYPEKANGSSERLGRHHSSPESESPGRAPCSHGLSWQRTGGALPPPSGVVEPRGHHRRAGSASSPSVALGAFASVTPSSLAVRPIAVLARHAGCGLTK